MEKIKQLREQIEELAGDIYEVGHAHGGNAFRLLLGNPSRKVDEGWTPLFEKMMELVEAYAKKESL